MSEVEFVSIGKLRRSVERVFEKSVKACRIDASLVEQVQDVVARLRMINALERLGVEKVSFSKPPSFKNTLPSPELERFLRGLKREGIQYDESYLSGGEAYVRLIGFGRYIYVVIPVSEPADPLGEPDMDYNGLRMYSPEKFREYILWNIRYVKEISDLTSIQHEPTIYELESLMPRGVELGYMFIDNTPPSRVFREYIEEGFYKRVIEYRIILDEGLRYAGVRVVRIVNPLYAYWLGGGKLIMVILRPEVQDEIQGRWRSEIEIRRGKIENIMEDYEVSEGVAKITPDLLDTLNMDVEQIENVRKLYEYCEGLYLLSESYYSVESPSIRHPLRILYLSRLAREYGLDGNVMTRYRMYGRSPFYVALARYVGYYGGAVSLATRPKKGLKINYRYNARVEDGCLVLVDSTLEGAGL